MDTSAFDVIVAGGGPAGVSAAVAAARGGPWKGFRVIATAEQIGHRDARRIHGRYTVTKEDIERGATFPDAVTTSRFGIDIHGIDKKMNDAQGALQLPRHADLPQRGAGGGVAAALAAKRGILPRDLPAAAIQTELSRQGVEP